MIEKRFRNTGVIILGVFFIYSIVISSMDHQGRFYYIAWSLIAIFFGIYAGINNKRSAAKLSKFNERMYIKTKFSFYKRGVEYYSDPDVLSFIRLFGFMLASIGFTILYKVLFLQ